MTYTLKHADWQWLIEPEVEKSRYQLKYKRPTRWIRCKSFGTPEDAADAVAQGRTGQKDWDRQARDASFPTLTSWLIDPIGRMIAPVLPALAEVVKSQILRKPDPDAKTP